ncbi:aspartate/glutamate racemase family protein [Desulfosporosinus nitroreducens]|uniref:Amino acid racemase n=1 Tax=Desulfosporosinus nitroreducens TaxID=2018668 RepID=A0ABT8QVT9_9FIRM|nr:amino acid racemase [Desulfosporosinus nitroreducens]MCO1603553.1 amino acid racemase [Desulfosporosinus nitroreducens]MDO0825458.1 amino acid racemase [Desulfosporosinus nitroreducens]
MKKVGMIGGFGPEATLDYYRLMIDHYRKQRGGESLPEIIIYSMDIYTLLNLVGQKRWEDLIGWLLKGIDTLYKAGADFGIISANTPHIVFDRLRSASPIPLISIVEETSKKAKEMGLKRVGLLGTSFTMQANFFQKEFDVNNISIVVPRQEDQDYIQHKLMTEIELGQFLEETRNGLLRIVEQMVNEEKIEGLILGCTELPLILTKDEFNIPFLNTAKIHAESVIRYCLGEKT